MMTKQLQVVGEDAMNLEVRPKLKEGVTDFIRFLRNVQEIDR